MSKLRNLVLIFSIAAALLGGSSIALWYFYIHPHAAAGEPKTIDEILQLTVDTNQITTNLGADHVIRVQFKIQVENEKAKEELVKRMYQVNHIILEVLSVSKPEDIAKAKGLESLETKIKSKINEIMEKGKVVAVVTTMKVIQ